MSDNGEAEEEDEPVVELGDGPDVEGAPVSRVASRLFFPIEESEVLRREGETTVRTPDGPQTVADVLEQSDEVYFETDSDLVDTVQSVVGTGPVATVDGVSAGETEADTVEETETDTEPESGETEAAETETADQDAEPEGAETGDPEDSEFEFDDDE